MLLHGRDLDARWALECAGQEGTHVKADALRPMRLRKGGSSIFNKSPCAIRPLFAVTHDPAVPPICLIVVCCRPSPRLAQCRLANPQSTVVQAVGPPNLICSMRLEKWCPGAELNHRHCDFQSHALPTELPGHPGRRRQPIQYATRPIKQRPVAIRAGPHPARRPGRGYDTGQSASARDQHRHSACCRTAGWPPPRACRRPDRSKNAWPYSCLSSMTHSVARSVGSACRIKGRPARRARSGNASASA